MAFFYPPRPIFSAARLINHAPNLFYTRCKFQTFFRCYGKYWFGNSIFVTGRQGTTRQKMLKIWVYQNISVSLPC